jgi:hypothetical protein
VNGGLRGELVTEGGGGGGDGCAVHKRQISGGNCPIRRTQSWKGEGRKVRSESVRADSLGRRSDRSP